MPTNVNFIVHLYAKQRCCLQRHIYKYRNIYITQLSPKFVGKMVFSKNATFVVSAAGVWQKCHLKWQESGEKCIFLKTTEKQKPSVCYYLYIWVCRYINRLGKVFVVDFLTEIWIKARIYKTNMPQFRKRKHNKITYDFIKIEANCLLS